MIDYVKCYTTKIPPAQSQGDIISILHRYGASGFGFRQRGAVVEVTFHIPDPEQGVDRTITIPVDIDRVHAKLQPKLEDAKRRRKIGMETNRAQAERVAWRILLDWIDAALSAVSIGAQTIEEAFYAHTVIETTDGQIGRLIDYVHTITDAVGAGGKLPNPGATLKALGSGK